MRIDNFSYELGNVAAVEAHEGRVTVEFEPNSASSTNGYTDRDQASDDYHLHAVLAGNLWMPFDWGHLQNREDSPSASTCPLIQAVVMR
jgi:hypothetical protein